MAVAQIDSAQPAPFQDTSRRDPAARIKPVRCGRSGRIHRSAVGGARGPTSAHGPVWLELYLEIANVSAEDDRTAYSWFEGSVSPWVDVQRPVVVWDDAEATLADFGLKAPDPATADDPGTLDATRALALLPHLYSLGTNRVVQELLRKGCKACVNGVEPEAQEHEPASAGPSSNGSAPDPIELFPLIGFHPERNGTPGLHFKTLRTNVAVIGETIVTVRLPDLPCPPEPRRDDPALSAEERGTWEALEIPSRFFPCWDAKARDFAEEIARHQAATGRALSDEVRMAMEPCTEAAPKGDSRGARVPDEEKIDELVRLGEAVEMADRQLSRVLRRLGSFGEEGGDGRASRGLSAASEIRRRYHYAVDEIRTLEKELDSARDRLRTHMDSRFQATVAFAGSAILIPTLVAGIFGANVWLPGERHTEGLFALLLFIVAFAAAGGLAIDRLRARRIRPGSWKGWSIAGIAVGSLVVAIVILLVGASAPRVTIDSPKDKAGVDARSVHVFGTVRPQQRVRLVSTSSLAPARASVRDIVPRGGRYAATVPVQPGTNEVCVTPLEKGKTVCVTAVGARRTRP